MEAMDVTPVETPEAGGDNSSFIFHPSSFPVRPLAALLLALAAQTLLEPPANRVAALALYLLAGVFVLWSYQRGEWTLPEPQELSLHCYPVTRISHLPLVASLTLLGAAFCFFGGNQFTWLNLLLWLAGIAFFVRVLWQNPSTDDTDKKDFTDLFKKEKSVLLRVIREIRVPYLIFLAILLIAAFFRFHQLNSVPAEPFSDHAEKILDLYDITQGQARIFFPRNTGREAIQFYWTVLIAAIFNTGLTFQSLKIGAALLGFFTLPFIYLLGKEVANQRVGLLAMLFAGVAYWPNVISRVGLRFPLYPLFAAPTLFFLLRGLRTQNRNDFILCGLCLGLGLHGYTPFRIAPLLVVVVLVLWWAYTRRHVDTYTRRHVDMYTRTHVDTYTRRHVAVNVGILFGSALVVFLPLLRYALEHPNEFWFRASSRFAVENPLPVFFSNLWNALWMFNVNDGNIFVNSVTHRPALDVVTGALFLLGVILLLARRRFTDLALASAVLILILPSVFSLAYPAENPALNRAGGALAPVFVIVAMTLDGLLTRLAVGLNRAGEGVIVAGVVGILLAASAMQNYDLVFRQYRAQYDRVVWRSSEMGEVIREFGNPERVWIVPYEQWVDTRLPGLWAGVPNRDFGLPRERLADTLQLPGSKLFIFKASPLAADFDDTAAMKELEALYPQGQLTLHESNPWWQSFWIYFVPAQ